MTELRLTKGFTCKIDDEDAQLISQYHWCADIKKDGRVYARGKVNGRLVYLHRWLLGEPDGLVDHEDRDTLNNQKDNLRGASHQQNSSNQIKDISRYKGVRKHRNKYQARIKFNYDEIYLGLFDSEEEAARAYDEAAKKLFGEFALLNFSEAAVGN